MDESEGTTFRTSARLMFVVMLLISLLAWVFVQAVFSLVAGRSPADLTRIAASGVLYAVIFSALWLGLPRRNWSSVQVTSPALGLVEKGADGRPPVAGDPVGDGPSSRAVHRAPSHPPPRSGRAIGHDAQAATIAGRRSCRMFSITDAPAPSRRRFTST